ncbi:unnamed protein product [Danaus chrysippus]|uniref:(African queen) hypothetical protein n=1 Tax=Danaus chrysippus TaxID=151541 RepID=A0A8J2R498_9NEOP|nr:unnamed protein product [Danaus chrysippus]
MTQLHIEEVYPKSITNPVLINFQNGYATDNFTTEQCFIYDNDEKETKTIATTLDGLVYAGEEETEDLGRTLILARNKSTGKVRVIESSYVDLKPVFKTNTDAAPLETSTLELSRKFGSKKQKQRMEQREKLKVNIETVTEQMQNVTQEITEDKVDLSSYNKTDSDDFYIPIINRQADKVEEVYDINNIFTEEQYEKIYSELEGKDYDNDLIPIIKSIVKNNLSQRMTVLAVYANYLLQLYITMMKEISKKSFTVCPHSVTLNRHILDNFLLTTNGKRTRPAPYKDKSLCYAMVMLLIINNCKFDLNSLCESIKITPNTAAMKVRVTGASVTTSGSKKVVQLKLPLNTKSSFRRRSAKF